MRVCGKNVFNELNIKTIRKVYIADNFKDKSIIEKIKQNKIRYVNMDSKSMDALMKHNQGIIIEVDDYEYKTLDEIHGDPLVVMLDHLEDPHNFGAIIRTCEALGVDAIIIPNDRSVSVNATVVKTSAGAISHIKIVRVANLTATINKLKGIGYWIVGTDMKGTDYTKIDYNIPVCLVIGNEGSGMSKIVRDNCDYIATIPMEGKVNSLNASVSLAIVLSRIVSSRG